MGKNEARTRLLAERHVYKDSPQVTVTYADLVRFIDNMLELTDGDKKIRGFTKEDGNT